MDIAITKVSSKGQIIIPNEMRGDICEGDKMVIIKNGHQLIMKKASELGKNLAEDLKFAKKTEKALKKYASGKFKEKDFEDFSEELKKW